MNHNNEKILEALHLLQDVCNKAKDCHECPLGNAFDDCKIMEEAPKDWSIVNPEIPRLLE